jgi:hypothetical protein
MKTTRTVSTWVVLLAALAGANALAQAPAPAAAAKPTAHLRYARLDGAASCPSPMQTENAVKSRLGYDPFRDDAKDVIEVFIEQYQGGLRARLQLKDTSGATRGKRELLSPSTDCSELSSALTLAIAIAVDPQAFLGGPPPPAPVASAPEVSMTPPPPPPLVEAERPGVHVRGAVGLLGLVGTTPGVTGGLALRVTVAGERWSVSLDGRGEWPRTLDAGPGTVGVTNLVGLVAPCFHVRWFGACGLVGGGVTRVTSTGLEGSKDGSAPFFQLGGRVQAMFELSRLISLGGSVDVLAPVTRAVVMVGDEQLWTTPALNASAGLFVAFTFT